MGHTPNPRAGLPIGGRVRSRAIRGNEKKTQRKNHIAELVALVPEISV